MKFNKKEEQKNANCDPLTNALLVSSMKNGIYRINKTDEKNKYYFLYNGVKVPFKVLFNMNEKTSGILGICFGTAKDCPSRKKGLCQLPNDTLCYARTGEKRATKKENKDGLKGMDSYFNGLLCSEFWDEFANNNNLKEKFCEYLRKKEIHTLRFNLKSDFRSEKDILSIYWLAKQDFNMTGYTARDDMQYLLKKLSEHEKVILNGSNCKYTNRFKCTSSIEEYKNAPYKCLGKCNICGNCYNLRDKEITVLLHGAKSEIQLNNEQNRRYIKAWFAAYLGIIFDDEDFKKYSKLINCVNTKIRSYGTPIVEFKNTKELVKYMAGEA